MFVERARKIEEGRHRGRTNEGETEMNGGEERVKTTTEIIESLLA